MKMIIPLFMTCFICVTAFSNNETHRPQVMTDEEKEEEVETAFKMSFAQVIANMITAAQNPASAPQCLANMIQTFINLLFTVVKSEGIEKEAFFEKIIQESYKYVDRESMRAAIDEIKRLTTESLL